MSTSVSYRQVRALYDDATITVYQAYSTNIASAAVSSQLLSASPDFLFNRMTWIKPSWNWMMYRSGYSYKDARQERILALKMRREDFEGLLRMASLAHGQNVRKDTDVRVQWDPERDVKLEKLGYRSIQIGIGRGVSKRWVEEWIVGIEDVTEKAREVKRLVDEGKTEEAKALLPEERPYPMDEELRRILEMDVQG